MHSDVAVFETTHVMDVVERSAAAQGDPVYATGHPLGRENAVTGGILVHTNRDAPATIQHDAYMQEGNSGGGLWDEYGRLIGMNAATDGLGYAIPYDLIKRVVDSYRATGGYAPACIGASISPDGTVLGVEDRAFGIIHEGETVISVDGLPPYGILYMRDPGDAVVVILENRTVMMTTGYVGEWMGIRACLEP